MKEKHDCEMKMLAEKHEIELENFKLKKEILQLKKENEISTIY